MRTFLVGTNIRRLVIVCGAALSLHSGAEAQVINSTWQTATSGDWFTASNWSTNPEVPFNNPGANRFYSASFPATGTTYTVTLSQPITLSSMVVSSSAARVAVGVGGSLSATGGIAVSSGRLNLSGGTLSGPVTLSGTGRIALFNNTTSVLDGVTITGGWVSSDSGGSARVRNGLSLTGALNMTGLGINLVFEGSQTLVAPLFSGGGSSTLPPRLDVDGTSVLTLSASSNLSGFATLGAQRYVTGSNGIINQGTITATSTVAPMRIKSSFFVNNGMIGVNNGGRMVIENAQNFVNNGLVSLPDGALQFVSPTLVTPNLQVINVGSNSTLELTGTLSGQTLNSNTSPIGWTLAGATILNSTLRGVNNVPFRFSSDTTFRSSGFTLLSNATLDNMLGSGGTIDVSGDLNILSPSQFTNQSLNFAGDTHLRGGELRLISSTLQGTGSLIVDPDATIVVPGGDLRLLDVQMVNDGLIRFENAARMLMVTRAPTFLNRAGTIEAGPGTVLDFQTNVFVNAGTILLRTGATLNLNVDSAPGGLGTLTREIGSTMNVYREVDLGGGAISVTDELPVKLRSGGFVNGTVNVVGDNALQFTDGRLANCTLNGNFRVAPIEVGAPTFSLRDDITVNGEIAFPGPAMQLFCSGMNLRGGTIRLDNEYLLLSDEAPTVVSPQGIIAGTGGISPSQGSFQTAFLNQGTLRADVSGGTLNVRPRGTIQNDGVLEVLEGASLWVGATVESELNGTLRIRQGTLRFTGGIALGPSLVFDREGGSIEAAGVVELSGRTLSLNSPEETWRVVEQGGFKNGTIELTNGAALELTPTPNFSSIIVVFDDCHVVGDLHVPSFVELGAVDTLRVDGDINVEESGRLSFSANTPSTTVRLDDGDVHLNSANLRVYGNARLILGPQTQIDATAPYTLTPSSARTIGEGNLTATIENQGRIFCDTPDRVVKINVGSFINNGVVEALNGGRAYIIRNSGNTWSNAGGVLRAGTGSEIITGGTVRTADLGTIDAAAGRWTLASAIVDNTGSTLHLGETTTGPLHVLADSEISGGTLDAPGWTGIILLREFLRLRDITVNTNISLSSFTRLIPSGDVNVNGVVTMSPASAINGPISGSSLNLASGEFILNGSGTEPIIIGGTGFQDPTVLTIGPAVHLHGGWAKFYCGTLQTTVHQGTITAEVPDAPITIFTSNFNNQGALVAVNGGSFIFQNAPGFGPNPANLDVRGSLRADTSSSLEASGWIHCFPASTTEITLGPAVPNQPIVSAGNDFRADGTLRIRFNPNFVPAAGNSWRLFTGEAISGQFSTLDLSPLPPGLGWNTSDLGSGFISIEPTCLWLGNGCFPDFTSDGSIDGDDVIAFFANWDDADPCADVDLSSGVDGDDVIAFFTAWDQAGAGVPGCE